LNEIKKFNLRVYGLLPNAYNEILIVHESINDFHFTKFPGGGLELGEGLEECLKREFREELNLEIKIKNHFYTTHFFQESAFYKGEQIISVYYSIEPLTEKILFPNQVESFGDKTAIMRFEWIPIEALTIDMMTFPIDKYVCNLLIQAHSLC
jgi:ADP-ribose pyrophosphatase YjhB (NUDIX family)